MVAEILCFKHLAIPVENALIPFVFRGKICYIIFQLWSYSGSRGMSFELLKRYNRSTGLLGQNRRKGRPILTTNELFFFFSDQ